MGGESVYEVDVRPDGMAVAGAFFVPLGKGGNGRGDGRGEYRPNGGQVRLWGLYEKPAAVKTLQPAPKK